MDEPRLIHTREMRRNVRECTSSTDGLSIVQVFQIRERRAGIVRAIETCDTLQEAEKKARDFLQRAESARRVVADL